MPVTTMILHTVVWPAVAAAVVLALAWIPALARARAASLVAPLAIAAGFLAGYWSAVGRPQLSPPAGATARLPHVALMGLAVAAVATWRPRRAVMWTATVIAAVAAMRLVFGTSIDEQWSAGGAALRVAALAGGMACTALAAAGLSRRLSPRPASVAVVGLAGLAAPLMVLSASVLLGQLEGALGVAAAVVAVGVWRAPDRIAITAAWPVVAALAWSEWAIALLFADLPGASFALLATAAPAALAAGWAIARRRPDRATVATLITLALALAAAVGVGALRYASSGKGSGPAATGGSDYGYGYGYGPDQ